MPEPDVDAPVRIHTPTAAGHCTRGTAEGIIVSIQYREYEFQMVYGHGEYAIPVEIHTPPLNGIVVGIHTPTAEGIMSTFNTKNVNFK